MIPVGGRTSTPATCWPIVVAETRQQARAAAELVEVDVRRAAAGHRSRWPRIARRRADRGVGHRRQRAVSVSEYARGDVDAGAGAPAPTPCTRCSRPSASSTPSSSRSRTLAVPDDVDGARHLHVYSGGQGVWDDRNDIARVLGVGNDAGHRRAGVERRRVRRQGGHEQPGADRAGRLAARAAGEVHAVARGELADPRQAPPDPPGVLGRLRRRRAAHRAAGARASATRGAYASGRHEGARAGRRPRQRAVPRARDRRARPSRCAPTTRSAARSAASAPTRRSSRWRACSTASPSRSASAAGRSASAT